LSRRQKTVCKHGTVAIVANDSARYTVFAASLRSLEVPQGTVFRWAFGFDYVRNRNQLVETMEGDWIWFIDDDHAFGPDILRRLLAHNLPITVPACLARAKPFLPVVWKDGERVDYQAYPQGGMLEVDAAGTAGMLIRRQVFDGLDEPYFQHGDRSEDIIFSERVREAGIPIHCDLDSRIGHATTSVIWPVRKDDGWNVGFSIADAYTIETRPW
jgi:hypothetical protein